MTWPSQDDVISIELLRTAFESEHPPGIFKGEDTHDPALRFVGQLVRYTQDADLIREWIAACLPENYEGNTLKEVPGMVKDAIKNNFHEGPTKRKKSNKPNISEECLRLVNQFHISLFHDSQMRGYISFPQEGGGELSYSVRSEHTERWLRFIYFDAKEKPINQHALVEVVATLEAKALFGNLCKAVHLRIGRLDDAVYIDPGWPDGRKIKINPEGWSITVKPQCYGPVSHKVSGTGGRIPRA